jgi:hypothetical protein
MAITDKVELPLERARGRAASTLEHGQGLIQNLLKVMADPPRSGASASGW